MQDLAARSGIVLCEGRETMALLPLTAGLVPFKEALARFDTVVGYKSGSHLPEVLAAVRDAGRMDGAVHGASLGLPGEDIRPAAEVTGPAPYLSTLLVPGLAEALKASIPVVAIVQEVHRAQRDRNAFQEIDQVALFAGCV